MVERRSEFEPVEVKAERLKEFLAKQGIDLALFDLDDTLIYTDELIRKHIGVFVEEFIEISDGISPDFIQSEFYRLNTEALGIEGISVSMDRWDWISAEFINLVGEEYREHVLSKKHVFGNIYKDEPRVRNGALEQMEIFKLSGVKSAIVTHANYDWTVRKLNSTGLIEFFEEDEIKVVDEKGFKDWLAWRNIIIDLGSTPAKTMVTGNSLNSDIIPAAQTGVKYLNLIDLHDEFGGAKEVDLPDGVMVLSGIDRLVDRLIA